MMFRTAHLTFVILSNVILHEFLILSPHTADGTGEVPFLEGHHVALQQRGAGVQNAKSSVNARLLR